MRIFQTISLAVVALALTSFGCQRGSVQAPEAVVRQAERMPAAPEAGEVLLFPGASTSTSTASLFASGTVVFPLAPSGTMPTATASAPTVVVKPAQYVNLDWGAMFEYPATWERVDGPAEHLLGGGLSQFAAQAVTTPEASSTPTTTTAVATTSTSTEAGLVPVPLILKDPVVLTHVVLPTSTFPGTNLQSAYLTLSVQEGLLPEACSSIVSATGTTGSIQINGFPYSYGFRSAKTAVATEDGRTLRTYLSGKCFEFDLSVYSGGTQVHGAYLKPVSVDEVFNQFGSPVGSARFR